MAAVRQKQEEKTRTLKVTRFFTYDPLIAGTVFCRSSTFSFLSMLLFLFTIQCVYFLYFPLLLCNIKRLSLFLSIQPSEVGLSLQFLYILSLSLLETWYISDLVSLLLLLLAVSFYFGGYRLASCFVILLLSLLVLRIDRTGPTFSLQYTTQKARRKPPQSEVRKLDLATGTSPVLVVEASILFFFLECSQRRVEDVCFI